MLCIEEKAGNATTEWEEGMSPLPQVPHEDSGNRFI